MSLSILSLRGKPRLLGIALFLAICYALRLFFWPDPFNSRDATGIPTTPGYDAGLDPNGGPASNATLGFEKILAISPGPSWRTRGLQAAAQLVGLDITIPPQIKHSQEAINDMRQANPGMGYGSTKAWIAHIDMLKYVVSSGLETALIIEDDVDFDLRIRHQTQALSDAMVSLNGDEGLDNQTQSTVVYGNHREWHLLWLGHCGSLLGDPSKEYADPTRIPGSQFFAGLGPNVTADMSEGHRRVHQSYWQMGTWAYAVTQKGAEKLLEQYQEPKGAHQFDISLLEICSSDNLICLTVSPSIFETAVPASDGGYLSLIAAENKNPDDTRLDTVNEDRMGYTVNIVQSARCMALWGQPCLHTEDQGQAD